MMFLQQALQSQNEMIQPVNADDAVPMDPADVEQLEDDTPDVVDETDV